MPRARNPLASPVVKKRRRYRFIQQANPTSPAETLRWLDLLEDLLGSAKAVAEAVGVTPVTYSRWRSGNPPTEWWRRTVYVSLFNEICAAALRIDTETNIIPVRRYPELARKIKLYVERAYELLDYSGMWFLPELYQEPVSKKAAATEFLYRYMVKGKEYEYPELLEIAEEKHNLASSDLQSASHFLKIQKRRHRVVINGKVRVWSTWVRVTDIDPSYLFEDPEEIGN